MAGLDTFPGTTDLRDRDLLLRETTEARLAPQFPNDGPGPRLLTANTIEGDKVVNLLDETLGTIDEIMLDMEHGRIAYVVMSSGGFLGLGERLFAIPWNALSLDPDRKCFVLDASKESFHQAPGFDKDHWPAEAQKDWHVQVHRYYRTRPYWE